MSEQESKHVESVSSFYTDEQLNFDKQLIRFRYESYNHHFRGDSCLELGPADGQMTKFLVNDFKKLTIVEGSMHLLNEIPDHDNLIKVHSLFEDFKPNELFDTIILEHILEHVEDPIALMQRVKKWLAPDGRIFLGVPNGNSIHRLAAVKMGLLKEPCELNSRDISVGHRRVYTHETFKKDVIASGLEIQEIGGVFFKPLSNGQIQNNWDEKMIQGFFELGKDFPEHSAEIYVVCS